MEKDDEEAEAEKEKDESDVAGDGNSDGSDGDDVLSAGRRTVKGEDNVQMAATRKSVIKSNRKCQRTNSRPKV